MTRAIRFIEPGADLARADVGGKAAGLQFLVELGLSVPPAFVVTTDAYHRALGEDGRRAVADALAAVRVAPGGETLERSSRRVRELILASTERHPLRAELRAAYDTLAERCGDAHPCVAVRSSSVAEDSAERSFAGEHDTFLWVRGYDELDRCVRQCWASVFSARALEYRRRVADAAPAAPEPAMAVVVQQMVPARSAGVLMTLNPANGDDSKVLIESVWGLGEPLVSGAVDPDSFLVDKITGEVVRRSIARKEREAVRGRQDGRGIAMRRVAAERKEQPSLTSDEVAELVEIGRLVERHAGRPQDAEFAVVETEGRSALRMLQCRPETVWANRPRRTFAGNGSALERIVATLKGTTGT